MCCLELKPMLMLRPQVKVVGEENLSETGLPLDSISNKDFSALLQEANKRYNPEAAAAPFSSLLFLVPPLSCSSLSSSSSASGS